MTLTINNSELRTWQTCRRKWYLRYHEQWDMDPGKEPLTGVVHLGSMVHFALEAWYGYHIDPVMALNWAYDQELAWRSDWASELHSELKAATVMVEGYLQWADEEGIDVGVEILGCEVPVSHEMEIQGQSVIIRGKLDQLARRESDGALIARDLKTVGTMAKAQQLRLSSQLKFYALIQALEVVKTGSHEVVAGGEYLLILRSKRTSRATGPFYGRVEVPLNRHDMNSQWLMTRSLISEIISARARLAAGEPHQSVAYPHFGEWCSWSCSYRDVCPLLDDGSRYEAALEASFLKIAPLAHYETDRIDLLRAELPGSTAKA